MAGVEATTAQTLRRRLAGTADLWDDLLRLARRVDYETTRVRPRRHPFPPDGKVFLGDADGS